MEIIKSILSDLELQSTTNNNEYVSETEIYEFIIENSGYNQIADSLEFFYIRLAATAISQELIRQDNYGVPSFDEDYFIELLSDRDEKEYLGLYNHYLGKLKSLEYHQVLGKTYFFSEGLQIAYDILIVIFAKLITADLNLTLKKLQRTLCDKVTLESWCDLITGGYEDDYLVIEKERMNGIINGVLR